MKKFYYSLAGIAMILVTIVACEQASVEIEEIQAIQKKEISAKKSHASASGSVWRIMGNGRTRTLEFYANTMADGTVNGKAITGAFEFNITCMAIDGNIAAMSGTITKYDEFPEYVGLNIWFRVEDNGQGSKSDADAFSAYWVDEFNLDCNDIIDDRLWVIHGGNIQVKEK